MCPIFLHRLEVSPKVESSSDVPPPLPPCPSAPPQYSPPSSSPSAHVSPDDVSHINVFTPSSSPSSNPLSPSNPFLPQLQHNPFFEVLVAEELQKSPPHGPCSSTGSSPFHYVTLPAQPCASSTSLEVSAGNMVSIKRERPRPVARQISLPALLPKTVSPGSPNHSAPCSASVSAGDWDDSFDAFATSRLNSPKHSRTSPISSRRHCPSSACNYVQEPQTCREEPPPLPPRRLLRTSVNEIFSDGWLHRGQELAVHKEAYLLSQTGVASRQHGREGECKRNSISPDPHTCSETSDSLSIHSQSCTSITSPGFTSEERLKKFKYEPLEDESHCWGGTLFEQDLYGRVCRGNYAQPRINSHCLSLSAEKTAGNNITSRLLDNELSVCDPFNMSSAASKVPDISCTLVEEIIETNSCETTCLNNNISFSLTLGDLNMNVDNSDFGFIDSDGSPQSEEADTLKDISNSAGTSLPEDSQMVIYQNMTAPEGIFTLKETYIPAMNSSYEVTPPSHKLCEVPPVCQDNCQDCELSNVALHGHCRVNGGDATNLLGAENECAEEQKRSDGECKKDCDDNGNPQDQLAKPNQSFSGVVSARIRPKGASRQNSNDSPKSKSEDREFEQFLSLVQNISDVREGPLSYQPHKSALSSLQALDKKKATLESSTVNDKLHKNESTTTSQISPNLNTKSCETEKPSEISFEALHAKVAPNSRTPSKTNIGKSLQEPEPCSPSTSSALSPSADTPVCCPPIHPPSTGPSASLAVVPYTSSNSPTFTTDQPLVHARHSLLPEENQPASNLPHQESR